MANAQAMRVIDFEAQRPDGAVGPKRSAAFPLRFVGRAWLKPNSDQLIASLERALDDAARPEQITEERVFEYCSSRDIPHPHFEAAVLRAAFDVVDPARVVEHLLEELRSCIPSLISKPYSCIADHRGNEFFVRLGADPFGEPHIVVNQNAPSWAVLPGHTLIAGSLDIDGTVHTGNEELHINAGWQVPSGTTCSDFAAQAASLFSAPMNVIAGWVAGTALRELSESIPRRLDHTIAERREPALLQIEKLLRLSGVSSKPRIHLLYWKRFRSYLIWSATAQRP